MNGYFDRNRKLAVLGLSRDPKAFSRRVYSFLKSRGFEMYAVNPNADDIDGQTCYHSVESLPEVEAALFFTPPQVTGSLLPACKARGITEAFFQQGSTDRTVTESADELGISYKESCVFLQFSDSGFPHNVHRFIVRILGSDQ